MTTLNHPAWCNPARCDADPAAATIAGYSAGTPGAHRSAAVPLDLRAVWPRVDGAAVELYQAVAPWPTAVYLNVRADDASASLPVPDARAYLSTVTALLDRAEPPRQGPDDLAPADTATRHGSPAAAGDDVCPAHDTYEWVEWLGRDDEHRNVWQHQCGRQWRTPVRDAGQEVHR